MSTQQRILDFITSYQQSKGYSPTFREIGEGVGLKSSSSASGHLDRLEKKGLVRRLHRSGGSIEIMRKAEESQLAIKMRCRVSVQVQEVLDDGTFKIITIGGNRYELDSMG